MEDKKAFWLWLLQRITAVLLFVILGLHVWGVHYVELGKPILFAGIAIRLKSLISLMLDSTLLLFGLFHGLNGLRMVLLDYNFFSKHEKQISWSLVLIGALFFIRGVQGLWAFLIR